jgi:hypothetical protein
MAATAPDACQGATFPLTLRAAGELLDGDPASSSSSPTIAFTGAAAVFALTMFALILLMIGVACWVIARERRADRQQS